MLAGARSRRAERQSAGRRARELDHVGDRMHRQIGIHQQHLGRAGDLHDRNEVGERIVGQMLVQGDVGGERRAGRRHQRVAVGRRARDRHRAGHRAGARAVLDDEGLAIEPLELAADEPGEHAVHAAGRRWRDDGDAAVGIVLRLRAWHRQRQRKHADDGGPMRNRLHRLPILPSKGRCCYASMAWTWRDDSARGAQPAIRSEWRNVSQATRSSSASSPPSNCTGRGGQPRMCRSTGTTCSTPPTTA